MSIKIFMMIVFLFTYFKNVKKTSTLHSILECQIFIFDNTPKTRFSEHHVRSLLFTKFSLDKEENMKKGNGVYSLN